MQKPVLMVLEDAHWLDPTSLELFSLIVERLARLRVMLVVTYRPEFMPPWGGQPHVTTLTLNRLGRRHGAALIESITHGRALPAVVVEQILARTDGVPLFVEELTKAVLELGLLKSGATGMPSPARCHRWRSRAPCTTRSWPGSTGWRR